MESLILKMILKQWGIKFPWIEGSFSLEKFLIKNEIIANEQLRE